LLINTTVVDQMAIIIKSHAKQRMKDQDIEVVTVLWVDERRLKTLGFT
jgi:hypothetical protein